MTLETYQKLLESHNWKYLSSTDPKELEQGNSERNNLLRLAYSSGEFRRAYFEAKEKHLPHCNN